MLLRTAHVFIARSPFPQCQLMALYYWRCHIQFHFIMKSSSGVSISLPILFYDNGIHNLACNFLYDFVNATPRYFTKHLYPQLQQSNTMSWGRWRKFLLPIGTLNLHECQVIRSKISSRYQRTCKDRLVTRACVMPRGLTILFAKKKQIKTNTGVAFGRFLCLVEARVIWNQKSRYAITNVIDNPL